MMHKVAPDFLGYVCLYMEWKKDEFNWIFAVLCLRHMRHMRHWPIDHTAQNVDAPAWVKDWQLLLEVKHNLFLRNAIKMLMKHHLWCLPRSIYFYCWIKQNTCKVYIPVIIMVDSCNFANLMFNLGINVGFYWNNCNIPWSKF